MRNRKNIYFICIYISILLSSCASQKPHYGKGDAEWSKREIPVGETKYSVYLLDKIDDSKHAKDKIFRIIKAQTENADTNHAIVFLEGDIKKATPDKKRDAWLDFLKQDKGKVYFIGGDNGGKKLKHRTIVDERKKYVEQKTERKNIFIPENDCPGPDEIKLAEDVLLIPINTSWYINNVGKQKGCKIDKPSEWFDAIKESVDNNQRKNLLLVGHHPLLNLGNHGGFFSWKQHIFPLTDFNKYLYIPLPGIGSLYPLLRSGFGTKKDVAYPRYKEMRKNLVKSLAGFDNIVYASAYENSLQYFNFNSQNFIITNSSGKSGHVGKMLSGFTDSNNGLVKISYLTNGDVWMEIIEPDKNDTKNGKIIYRKLIKESLKPDSSTISTANINLKDSTVTIAADPTLQAGKLKILFLGKDYRDVWSTPVKVPVINLSTEQGGLEIIKKGGGFQTKSLQLRNKSGEDFSLRSVVKYPERLLGPAMKNTIAADLVRDQTVSNNPFAPYVVDELSKTAGIMHTDPKLVFIPNDIQLAEYRTDFANTLGLFEKRADGDIKPAAEFNYALKSKNSLSLLDEIMKKNTIRIDDYTLLKSRLFDMWINDWDRHEGQWRWGFVECTDSNAAACGKLNAKDGYYVPIPKDRDQAFSKFQGILPWIAGRKWVVRKFQNFSDDIRDVPGLNFNARNFDRAFLSRLSRSEWDSVASELKRSLTDEKIESGIKVLPDEIYKIDGAEIISKLKSRRNNINKYATEYYNFIAKFVDVKGSDQKEIFEITRLNDDATDVKVFDDADGQKGDLIYHRTFLTKETKEVRIYGLGNDDVFNITGNVNKGIKIRIIGGKGDDVITDNSHVKGWGKKTKIYDDLKKNSISTGTEGKDLTSSAEKVNDYDYFSYNYDLVAPATFFGFNVDDGLYLGGGILIRHHGFRKEPYSSSQRIVANRSLKNKSFNIKYDGDFHNVFNKWGININALILAPNSVTNFFGLGNDTKRLDIDNSFYRIRYNNASLFAGFKRPIGLHHSIKAGPLYEYIKVDKTPGRFISLDFGNYSQQTFQGKNYVGGKLEYKFEDILDSVLTFRGIKFIAGVETATDVANSNNTTANFESNLSVYIPLSSRATVAIRTGGATRVGKFEFYQGNTLGGQIYKRDNGNARGYVRGRFAGRTVAYSNADLRIKVLRFHTYLFPAHFGVLGFYDVGRVWNDHEKSNTWHKSYGGGIWIDPFGLTVINLSYGISDEDKLFNIGVGFLF